GLRHRPHACGRRWVVAFLTSIPLTRGGNLLGFRPRLWLMTFGHAVIDGNPALIFALVPVIVSHLRIDREPGSAPCRRGDGRDRLRRDLRADGRARTDRGPGYSRLSSAGGGPGRAG